MSWLLKAALLLCAVLACTKADYYYDSGADDPIEFFATLAKMPEQVQNEVLKQAGKALMDQSPELDCNIFGGTPSCKNIPDKSKFGSTCKPYREDLRVDCAYFSDSEKQLEIHPGDALRHHLGDGDYNNITQHCPECIENLQALWCVQALPECGSFMTHVHKAIFPAILEVKQEEDLGLPESTAIAAAIPSVVQAMSKTMACREMCHATIATCSCGNATLTFGEALENAEVNDDGFAELGLQLLGQNFSDTLFAEIWDKPVCDIFTSKDDADFAGECTTHVVEAATCGSDKFCTGLSDKKKKSAESIIATQIARSVFGFVDGPAGIVEQGSSVAQANISLPIKKPGTGVGAWATGSTTTTTTATTTTTSSASAHASAAATTGTIDANSDTASDMTVVESPQESTKGQGSSVGTLFGVIFGLAVVGALGTFGWKKYQAYKLRSRGFADFSEYDPMGMDEGIPLQ